MRIFLLFFPVFFFCGLLHAQTVKVEYGGDPLPDKDRKKIEQFLQHEVDFYSQFGLPDTLSLQLYVFENRREAIDYLESINVSLPIKASGAYSPKLQKAVILGRERSLAIIYHELSHHFVSQILGKRPPSWLNERAFPARYSKSSYPFCKTKMIRQPFQNKSILFIPEASSNSKKILKPPTNNINLSIK